jgi:hypothetical protein
MTPAPRKLDAGERMTPERLEEIEAGAKAATEGPWLEGGPYPGASVCIEVDGGSSGPDDPEPTTWEPICVLDDRRDGEPHPQVLADRAFIAHAREDVPALIAEIRRLKGEVERLHGLLNDVSKYREAAGSALVVIRGALKRWENGEAQPASAMEGYEDP